MLRYGSVAPRGVAVGRSVGDDAGLDGVDDVAHVVVGDVGPGGQADAHGEEGLADAVDVGRSVAVDGLTVHGLPQRPRLDVGGIEGHTQGLDVGVGLAVGDGRGGGVRHACGATHGARDNLAVGGLLTADAQVGVERGRAQPKVRV